MTADDLPDVRSWSDLALTEAAAVASVAFADGLARLLAAGSPSAGRLLLAGAAGVACAAFLIPAAVRRVLAGRPGATETGRFTVAFGAAGLLVTPVLPLVAPGLLLAAPLLARLLALYRCDYGSVPQVPASIPLVPRPRSATASLMTEEWSLPLAG